MNMVIPDEGKEKWLENLFAGVALEDFEVKLFSNNETVDDLSTAGDFTIATFTGYADWPLARADFSVPVIVANVGETEATPFPEYTCTGGSPQTVYGWIMVGDTSGLVYAGQNFDTPRVMSAGATESLDPFKVRLKTFT